MMKMESSLSRRHRDWHLRKTIIFNGVGPFDEETIMLMMKIAEVGR
jgi:hypothetical protein